MKKEIEFYTKEVYGLPKKYVVDNELANTIATLTGRKTLLDSDVKALEKLGFVLKEVLRPIK